MNLTEQAEVFVKKLFKDRLSSLHTYHNLKHTIDVVTVAKTLADAVVLTPSDR